MLTKVGDPSCVKTAVGGKQEYALRKRQKAPKSYLIKKFVKELAPSPWQLLNGQGLQRISGLQKFELRLGSRNGGSFCERDMEACQQLRQKKVDICYLQKVRGGEGKELNVLVLEVEDISCGGLEKMLEQEVMEF